MWPLLRANTSGLVDADKKHEHLKDYTLDELYEHLGKAEQLPGIHVACFCAEILLRQRVRNEQ